MQKKVFERVLNMAQMFNAGLFHRGPNMLWTCRWSEEGEESGIGFELQADRSGSPLAIWLRYKALKPGQNGQADFNYGVAIKASPSYTNKTWYWYVCPLVVNGTPCQRRVRNLYFLPSSELFGCKHCRDLLVQSLPLREQRVFYRTFAPNQAGSDHSGQSTGNGKTTGSGNWAQDEPKPESLDSSGWRPQPARQPCQECGCRSEGLFCCNCGIRLGKPERDFLEILGVPAHASEEDVRVAFKSRLKEYHPDKVAHLGSKLREVAEEELKRINLAYEILKDPLKRDEYLKEKK